MPPVFAITVAILTGSILRWLAERRHSKSTLEQERIEQEQAHRRAEETRQAEQAERQRVEREGREQERQRQSSSAANVAKHYRVLGLEPGASEAEIKKAHRGLVQQFHTDRLPGVTHQVRALVNEKMQEINLAKEALMSARRK